MSAAQYERHVARLKQDCNKVTSESRIILCRHLRQLEDKTRLWTPFFATFGDFIEEHLFCDPTVYDWFKTADEQIGKKATNHVGFWAATRIITVEEQSLRDKLLGDMRSWVDDLGAHPSYQAVDRWLRHNYPEVLPSKQPSDKTLTLQAERDLYKRSYDRLRKENRRLKRANAKLREEVAALQAN